MGRRLLVLGIALLFGAGTAQGQSISGTLTDAVTGLPLGNIPILKPIYGVQVVGVDGKFVTQVFTLQNGTYQADVPAGTYFVWAFALGNYHVPELYNNLPCIAADCVYTAGTPVVVSSGTTVVDIALGRSGGFSGTVRQTGGSPLVNARILVYNAAGSPAFHCLHRGRRHLQGERPCARHVLRAHPGRDLWSVRVAERHRRTLRRLAMSRGVTRCTGVSGDGWCTDHRYGGSHHARYRLLARGRRWHCRLRPGCDRSGYRQRTSHRLRRRSRRRRRRYCLR